MKYKARQCRFLNLYYLCGTEHNTVHIWPLWKTLETKIHSQRFGKAEAAINATTASSGQII